jgi:hypothetical protein
MGGKTGLIDITSFPPSIIVGGLNLGAQFV